MRSLLLVGFCSVACAPGLNHVRQGQSTEPEWRTLESPAPVRASPEPRPSTLAVFELSDQVGVLETDAQRRLSQYTSLRVAELMPFNLVPSSDIKRALLDAKAEGFQSCYDEACQIAIGKALAAEKVLNLSWFKSGESCRLTATLYDLRTEVSDAAATVPSRCVEAHLLSEVDALVEKLASRFR